MMRPGASIFLQDYGVGDILERLTFSVSSSVEDGIYLNLSLFCLDHNLEAVSRHNSEHCGDQRDDTNTKVDEDETIHLAFSSISDIIHHIGFVVKAHITLDHRYILPHDDSRQFPVLEGNPESSVNSYRYIFFVHKIKVHPQQSIKSKNQDSHEGERTRKLTRSPPSATNHNISINI
jgi:hypothetical protein